MSGRIIRCPYPETITALNEGFARTLWTSLEKHKSSTALVEVETGQVVTYGELRDRAELVARRLLGQGCRRHDVVAIFSPNSVDWVLVIAALFRIGAVPAAINSLLTVDELLHQLRVCRAKFIYTSQGLVDAALQAAKSHSLQRIFVSVPDCPDCVNIASVPQQPGEVESLPRLPSFEELDVRPDDLAAIYFSSGTTGLQKGVMLPHRSLQQQLAIFKHPRSRVMPKQFIAFAPLAHVSGSMSVLMGLALGTKMLLMMQFDPFTYLKLLDENKIEQVGTVPPIATLLAKSVELDMYRLSHIKEISVAAAPLSAELEDQLLMRFPGAKVRQAYGMTEVGAFVTLVPYDDKHSRKPGSVGVPQPGCELKVIDIKTGAALGPRAWGEVCIRSPGIMLGYANNPEATAATIESDGWMHTGDIGYYDEDGYFFIVDRLKELIKYNAYQVPPAELEAVLLSHPDVADAAVVGLPDKEHGELPLAWVVKKPSATVTETQLQQFVKDKVAPYKRLRGGVQFVADIPKTPSGKISRKHIKAALLKGKL